MINLLLLLLSVISVKGPGSYEGSWETPTSIYDPDEGWNDNNEDYIIDDNKGTYGSTTPKTVAGEWSVFIELNYSGGILCDSVRYWTRDTYEDSIDIDIYYSSSWHDVFMGVNVGGKWIEKYIGGVYEISKARVRLHNGDASSRNVRLHEFDVWETP